MEAQCTTPSMDLDDAELVGRTLSGRRAAFDELVRRYQRRAASVSFRFLGNLHDALEASQEAFVRAYQNLASLENRDRFGPWLLRIVTNLSLNFRRSRGLRASFEDCLLPDEDAQSPRGVGSREEDRPESRLQVVELESRIQGGLSQLTESQRTALVLFSIEQLPQKDVAEIMECSVEAVKWHVFQARKRMKEHLAEFL